METLLLVVQMLPELLQEHGTTVGVGGGSLFTGGLGTYLFMTSRLDKIEALLEEKFSTMSRDIENLSRASSERDAYQEGRIDEAVREARGERGQIFNRLDRMNTRLSFLEGRINGARNGP